MVLRKGKERKGRERKGTEGKGKKRKDDNEEGQGHGPSLSTVRGWASTVRGQGLNGHGVGS